MHVYVSEFSWRGVCEERHAGSRYRGRPHCTPVKLSHRTTENAGDSSAYFFLRRGLRSHYPLSIINDKQTLYITSS